MSSLKPYIVFDVETPNARQDRICALGIATVENDVIVDSKYYLINPECKYDDENIAIHHITPQMTEQSPSFKDVWDEIAPLFSQGIIVGHNVQFDLSVLKKTLNAYSLEMPGVEYLCTLQLFRSILSVPSYSLGNLCAFMNIELDAHNALSDCVACATLLCRCINQDLDLGKYYMRYGNERNYCGCDHGSYSEYEYDNEPKNKHWHTRLTSDSIALQELCEFLAHITADNELSDVELAIVKDWMDQNEHLRGNFPYDKIFVAFETVLADGVVDMNERDELLSLFKQIVDPVSCSSQQCNCIDITGKKIVLTGDFDFGSRDSVINYLTKHGAEVTSGVSRKTNIVLVGNQGSEDWVAGNYGTKVKKAMELQASGFDISIVKESDFSFD